MPSRAPTSDAFILAAKQCEIGILEELTETCDVVTAISELVHELQRERALPFSDHFQRRDIASPEQARSVYELMLGQAEQIKQMEEALEDARERAGNPKR